MATNREKLVVRYRRTLESIRDHRMDSWDDYMDAYTELKAKASAILAEADQENVPR